METSPEQPKFAAVDHPPPLTYPPWEMGLFALLALFALFALTLAYIIPLSPTKLPSLFFLL
jgi:hypothetical protein